MKETNNSSSLLKLLKTIFKPKKSTGKNTQRKHQPRWMYRND